MDSRLMATRLSWSLSGLLMAQNKNKNPYSPSGNVDDASGHPLSLSQNPFSLCYLPFAVGSWLILSVLTAMDAPAEHSGHFPFAGLNAILFSIFLMSPLVAFVASLISSGWVQIRLGNDYSRIVRRKTAFVIGCLAPIIAYFGLSLIMVCSDVIGDAVNWIFVLLLIGLYLSMGECVVRFSKKQTDAAPAR